MISLPEKTTALQAKAITPLFAQDTMQPPLEAEKEESLKKDYQDEKFHQYTFLELLNRPTKEWLVDQIFGAGEIGMFYGPSGCGKTFVVIDMIIALCSKDKFANEFAISKPLNVAYCAGEGLGGLRDRFAAAAIYHEITDLQNFTFFEKTPQLYEQPVLFNNPNNSCSDSINQFISEWKKKAVNKKLDVLIIDTLHTASVGADENSSRDMGKVLQLCRSASIELGCTVILVHHTNKARTGERGSSALRGAMDFMIEIKPKEDNRKAAMHCSKLKDGEEWQDQGFELKRVDSTKNVHVNWTGVVEGKGQSKAEDKESIISAMKEYDGTTFLCKSIAEIINQHPSYTNRLLGELVAEKKCYRELEKPEKAPSNKNPWLFFLKIS